MERPIQLCGPPVEIAVAGESGLGELAGTGTLGRDFCFGLSLHLVLAPFVMFFCDQDIERGHDEEVEQC